MQPIVKARLQIHLAVLLWGFTSILGKQITPPALALTWWRMLFAVAALAILPQVWRGALGMPRGVVFACSGVGVLLAMHWVTFYGAIKVANASVAATCLGLAPAFVAVVDPLVGRRRFDPRELLLGVAVAPGVALVVGAVPTGMRFGVLLGTVSAVLVAFYGVLTKRLIGHADSLAVTWIQLGVGFAFLSVVAALAPHEAPAIPALGLRDAALLLVLAWGCTLLPLAAYLAALRRLPAFAIQLTVNLEPVYSILLAVILLGEQRELNGLFYVGVAIILGAVFAQPAFERARA